MKLLLCSPIPTLDPRLGAARVVVDLAEAWRSHGWACDLFPNGPYAGAFNEYPQYLASYLAEHAGEYDVVDFPYTCAPWITEAHNKVLKVARVVLLAEHTQFCPDPQPPLSLRSVLARMIRFRRNLTRSKMVKRDRLCAAETMAKADLITVGNTLDKQCLGKVGIPPGKVMVVPYGITQEHRDRLAKVKPKQCDDQPVLVFLGTFDYRKGCLDFPAILRGVQARYPSARMRLVGTRGMCANAKAVLQFFPAELRASIEVFPRFSPEELPNILKGGTLGFFPSYREGFGIGVVEMLAAGLPVVAYDVPGPCDILPSDWLVPRGDQHAFVDTLCGFLVQSDSVDGLAQQARSVAGRFLWTNVAGDTHKLYREALEHVR